ncbi:sulfite exporter TauE/SafE family protein [Emcibacter sp.]|uniref:sulfite exporter TauE/SafE family protein n=1 Tax=Emcibacter sp. TaxID=1979954 RepID=UPI002AA88D83|nr:sulfite exporter TauE/SafE family protein [Emcibacter sp.]
MENILGFVVLLASASACAGILAGMLGVGGGIILVPVLHFIFGKFGISEDVAMHMAVGTSLTTIVPTSIVSARSHHGKGAVDFALLKAFAPTIIIGVVAGSALADTLRGQVLSIIFGVVALFIAIRLAVIRKETTARNKDGAAIKVIGGFLIGGVSALMGIGGGTFSVAVLSKLGYGIHRAVGTSAAIGLLIALPGSIGFMITGTGTPGLPPYSIGYVNLLAVLCVIPATMLATPFGVRIAHWMPDSKLRITFSLVLGVMAIRMLVTSL